MNKLEWHDAQEVFPKPNQEVLVATSFDHNICNMFYITASDGEHFWDNKKDLILQADEVDYWAHLNRP